MNTFGSCLKEVITYIQERLDSYEKYSLNEIPSDTNTNEWENDSYLRHLILEGFESYLWPPEWDSDGNKKFKKLFEE